MFNVLSLLVQSRSYSYLYSALKRNKAYSTLEDVRPTLKNKPSGLRIDWHSTVTKSSVPRQPTPTTHARSSSSSTPTSTATTRSSSSSTPLMSPPTPSSPPPEFDHTSLLLALSPLSPFSIYGQLSPPPSHGNLVPLVDSRVRHRYGHSPAVHILISCHSRFWTYPSSLLFCLTHTGMTKDKSSSLVSRTCRNGYTRIFATFTSAELLSRCVQAKFHGGIRAWSHCNKNSIMYTQPIRSDSIVTMLPSYL